ncbi:MAG: tyrosine-type recombinase/integrase [Dehalococcoidales bacterium]|nr:tyrosine-type recombinase/integrase [Dehalococcoidales bacterium]
MFLKQYQVAARAAGLSQSTVNHVTLCVTLFSRYLGEAADVGRVKAEDYRSFLVSLQERRAWEGTPFVKPRPLSPGSINTYARGIHSFWSWLKREGLIRNNPLATVPAPKLPKRLPRAFSEEEVKKILIAVKNRPRDRAMVQLVLDSGIRLSECLGLALKDVDFIQGRLRVYGKGSKERYAYFSRQTAE